MDGVILAGGLASRLGPITKVTNKHLLPIYDKPMIFYGIELLRDLGCERIVIILGGNSVGDIVNLVRDGSSFGIEIVYKYQHEPRGISQAINLARDIIDDGGWNNWPPRQFLVLLGDNIFSNGSTLKEAVDEWQYSGEDNYYAIFLKESDHAYDYGQPIFINGQIDHFVEKDKTVDHNAIVTGLYGLTTQFFRDFEKQSMSSRGEFEITDSLSDHIPLIYSFDYDGFWSDCGTPEGLIEASKFFAERGQNENSSIREESAIGVS